MTRQQNQTACAQESISVFPAIFGPHPSSAAPDMHRLPDISAKSGARVVPNGDADAFFRAHPDALLEGLLAETAAAFGDPVSD
ncbi:MAG: hypothetical protein ACYDHM_10620 [Acidiferrobacterales bacterium]